MQSCQTDGSPFTQAVNLTSLHYTLHLRTQSTSVREFSSIRFYQLPHEIKPNLEPEGQSAQEGCSASSSGPSDSERRKQRPEENKETRSPTESSFLVFLHLIEQYHIPIIDPRIADARQRSDEAVGILGNGGQFVVDRTYNNQR
jgi:hypothetical protein